MIDKRIGRSEEEAGGASQIKKRDWCIISKLGKEVNYARI